MANSSQSDVPLIWTTKGNVPVEALTYIPRWTVTVEQVEFVEEFYLGAELVRRNVHIHNMRSPHA